MAGILQALLNSGVDAGVFFCYENPRQATLDIGPAGG
jgi:hypothetical protein